MTTVVLAPDKFKGSLTATEVAAALARGIRRSRPDVTVVHRPVADGGEGTTEAFLAAGFSAIGATVSGPWGRQCRTTRFAVRHGTAVVELAATVASRRAGNPLTANTAGFGQLIAAALDRGCVEIVLAVGGSVSTDGGAGMMQALGAVLRDGRGEPLPWSIGAVGRAARLDVSTLDPRLSGVTFVLAADVDNPLLGPNGAAAVFGPQKGATPAQVAILERTLGRWSQLVGATTGTGFERQPGAGAAGGTGFAALALLGAQFRRGIDVVRGVVELDRAIAEASLVVTGEGCLDSQSLSGKAPVGVAAAARAHGVPVVAVAGTVALDGLRSAEAGFAATYALTDVEPDRAQAISRAADLLAEIGATRLHRHIATTRTIEELT